MCGVKIKIVHSVKDLGVTVAPTLKFFQQCNEFVEKANRMMGLIKRNFSFKDKDVVQHLYDSYVRPHLEYACSFGLPTMQKTMLNLKLFSVEQPRRFLHYETNPTRKG